MKKKFLVFLALYIFVTLNLRAQDNFNPFKSIGKDARVLTLSDGKYAEFFDTDSIAIVGSAVLNINTMKIIGFIVTDTAYSEATLEPEIVSRWLSIDPLARKYPSESPYIFTGDNPIYYIDVEGKYKYPADKAAAYAKKYPMITKYLQNQVKQDVMKSSIILTAFSESTNGNLTRGKVDIMTTWGEGPRIEFTKTPGWPQTGATGYYEPYGDEIQLNSDVAEALEKVLQSDASDADKMTAFLPFYNTLLHESTHRGNYDRNKEKIVKDLEVGDEFEKKVWGKSGVYNPDIGDNLYDVDTANKVINEQNKSEEGRNTLPTLAE